VSALQPLEPQAPESSFLLLSQEGKNNGPVFNYLPSSSVVSYFFARLLPQPPLFALQLCGIYQTAQNMSSVHLRDKCDLVPTKIRQKLLFLKEQKTTNTGGRKYWVNHAASGLGVCSIEGQGMRFLPR
jgi:hypothetical protein